MTKKVLKVWQENNIILVTVPENSTYLFQPLDVQSGPKCNVNFFMRKNGILAK